MRTKSICVNSRTRISFTSKLKYRTSEYVCIRIIGGNNNILFEKDSFSLEEFELQNIEIDKPERIAVEILDTDNVLSLEYFVIYDEKLYKNGVVYLDVKSDSLKFVGLKDMNSYYSENKYRNQFHFSPLKGWINDPNGLIYFKGYYHMFFQYYPHAACWGNMHWGHAVSNDLIHWKHFPIALMPGKKLDKNHLGGAFSGNAIEYNEKMHLFFTDHFESKSDSMIFVEEQCIAESSDGIHFKLNPDNPVIAVKPEKSSKDFRDPKVFKDTDGLWKMILGGAYDNLPSVLIYSSDNMIDWNFEGPLYQEKNIPGRAVECPDFFKYKDKYVLMLSVFQEEGNTKNYFTRYIVGDYANNRFDAEYMGIIDFGPDFYATQTFLDGKDRRIGIAWIENWMNEIKTQPYGFSGAMSLPREFYLDSNNRLKSKPVDEVLRLRKTVEPVYSRSAVYTSEIKKIPLNGDNCLEVLLDAELSDNSIFCIKFRQNDLNSEFISVEYNIAECEISIVNNEKNCVNKYSAYLEPLPEKRLSLKIFLDCSCIEVFANDYKISGTVRYYIESENKDIVIADTCNVFIRKLDIWYLNSCW